MLNLILAQAAQAAQTAQPNPAAQPQTNPDPNVFINFFQTIIKQGHIWDLSIKLIGAIFVLFIGWLLAIIISKMVKKGLNKIGFSQKFNKVLPEEDAKNGAVIENWIKRIVFYTILLITILAFLNVFGLSSAAEPIKELLNKLSGYGANLVGAVILIAIAWITATIVRYICAGTLSALHVDERISKHLDDDEKERVNIAGTIAETFYWLVFLCFLPGILSVLKIDGIVSPFKDMISKVLVYLPNFLSAVVVFIIGLFTAKILKKIVTLLLISIGTDDLSQKTGLNKLFGEKGFSKAIGILVYAMVVLPTLAIALNVLKIDSLSKPVSHLIEILLNAFSGIFGVAILIFAAHIVGQLLKTLTAQLLESFGFNKIFVELRLFKEEKQFPQDKSPSYIIGKLIYIVVMIFAAIASADILGFKTLGTVIASFVPVAGRIILGFVVFLIGFYFASITAEAFKGDGKNAGVISLIIRSAILIFVGAMALHCMGIADEIVQIAFASIVGAVAIAIAIAFGLGGRDAAAQQIQEWKNAINGKSKK